METFEIDGPDYWASYLVNGDASSLTAAEKAQADAWLKRARVSILGTTDDEARFTWHYRLHAPECDCAGGSVLTYIATTREA